MLFGQVAIVTTEQLRLALGVDQPLTLDDPEVRSAWVAARQDRGAIDRLAVAVALCAGRQLPFQYPSSSLLWDLIDDELHDVLAACGLEAQTQRTWSGPLGEGRTLVVELRERPSTPPDERRFTLQWGVVLSSLPFCRHHDHHGLACCAVLGGLGALQSEPGDHVFVLSTGLLAERLAGNPAVLVGLDAFRARMQRLVSFGVRLGAGDNLAAVVAGRPWRAGIGIAEQLRQADPEQLRRLLA